jgi:ribosome-binding factor A
VSKERRTFRVAEKIQSIIASQVLRLSDPRFFLVTITHVVISSDLRNAKVYWVTSGDQRRINEVGYAFESAQGVIRSAIAREVGMRLAPQLRFYYDDTLDTQQEVNEMINRISDEG